MNQTDGIRTREIAEAAVFYISGLPLLSYQDKHWFFGDAEDRAAALRMDLINKRLKIEPLEFMDAIRRVKSFSNEGK